SFGTVATLSFFPSKNLGAFGDAGAVATDDDAVAERGRMLRFHGSRDKQTFELVGRNSRLDELQAALLRVQLPELDGWAAARRAVAREYAEACVGGRGSTRGSEWGSWWRGGGGSRAPSPPGTCTSCARRTPRRSRRR